MKLLNRIHSSILAAYEDLDHPRKSFLAHRGHNVTLNVLKCLAKSGIISASDDTDLNYDVCSTHMFLGHTNNYQLLISHVDLFACVLLLNKLSAEPVDLAERHNDKILVGITECLKKNHVININKDLLEVRVPLATELCDPKEATVYNALFSDVISLPWR